MELTILGSGTAVPVPDRLPSGALLRGGGQCILIDLGPGTLRQLPRIGIGLEAITAVLLTHYHTDHTADLAALLFALRNPRYRGRPRLAVRGAPNLHRFLQHLTAAWPWLQPQGEYELDAAEITPGRFALGELSVEAVAIRHTAQSLAYRITSPGGAVVALSGDADECDGLIEVAADADLFVCDCAFPDELRTAGHLTPKLAAQAAERARVKKLCLTHFYPECLGHDLLAQARAAGFRGELVLATDLARFELGS
jgi:ribonuclease BN (tRNA processing enzyme)